LGVEWCAAERTQKTQGLVGLASGKAAAILAALGISKLTILFSE